VPMPWDFDLIAPEIDNIRAVLEWSVESDPERGLHLAGLLESFWVVRDPLGGATWLRRLLAAAPDADPRLRAVGLRALGGSLDIYGDHAGAAPCYQESLVLFMNLRDEPGAAHLRFRIASNMVMQGDSAAAWPLLEASLAEARSLGAPIAESQALGFLVGKARAEGDLELALSQALESARLAQDAGWMWWAAGQLDSVADIERDRGRLDEAEACALRAYDIALGLGDRQRIVFSGAGLAAIAALRGDAARAGELWGAVEAETGAAPVGQWDKASAEVRPMVLRVNGPVFDNARERGRLLSVPDAIALGRR